jgi:hypothetical protein
MQSREFLELEHREQAAGGAVVRQDLDLVLLVGTVAPVQPCGACQAVGQGRCAHVENYNRFARPHLAE